MFALGGLMLLLWAIRFAVFQLLESPRYLVAQGEDVKAVAVIQKVAAFNGKECSLTIEQMLAAGSNAANPASEGKRTVAATTTSSVQSISNHVRALFKTPKMALSTCLLVSLWGECTATY